MKILGLDPSFASTGFAILKIENEKIFLIEIDSFKQSNKLTIAQRLENFFIFLKNIIKKNKITHCVIETPFLGKNSQVFLKLGYLRGIIYLLCQQNKITLSEFSPREIKQTITGNGSASKAQVLLSLKTYFPQLQKVNFTDFDQTDALAIALTKILQTSSTN